MKLGPDVLVEIMSIIQTAIVNSKDASEGLRAIDVVADNCNENVILSDGYLLNVGRKEKL